jgi:disulfide oxidoreductase YuzD
VLEIKEAKEKMMMAKTRKWMDSISRIIKTDMVKVLEDPRVLPVADAVGKDLEMRWQLHVEDKVIASGKSIYDPGQVEFVMDPSSVNIARSVPEVVEKDAEMRWQIVVEDKVVASGKTIVAGGVGGLGM